MSQLSPYVPSIKPPAPPVTDFTGSGSPEGIVTASPPRTYLDTDTNELYFKASGDGTDTGWELVSGSGGGGGSTNASDLTSGTLAAARLPAFTGDEIVSSVGTGVLAIVRVNFDDITTEGTLPVLNGGTGATTSTGTGATVRATSPTLVTPVLGVAAATSINRVAFTAPATSATLTISDGKTAAHTSSTTFSGTDGKTVTFNASLTFAGTDGKTLTVSNNLTLAGTDGTTLTFQGTDTYVGRATTDTLTNKRVTARVETLTDAATVTPASDSNDGGKLTALSQASQIANPTGTPTAFQRYILRIKSTTARALTYGSQFRGSVDLPLPSVTSGSSLTDYLVFQWNADDTKWDLVGKNFGF